MSDLIERQSAIEAISNYDFDFPQYMKRFVTELRDAMKKDLIDDISLIPTEKATDKWIPIEWHEITDEEREEDVYPEEWEILFDCEMPCDGEEIIVQTKHGYINMDVCYEDDGLHLDSGCDWIEDIVAWRPLPEPYGGGE